MSCTGAHQKFHALLPSTVARQYLPYSTYNDCPTAGLRPATTACSQGDYTLERAKLPLTSNHTAASATTDGENGRYGGVVKSPLCG